MQPSFGRWRDWVEVGLTMAGHLKAGRPPLATRTWTGVLLLTGLAAVPVAGCGTPDPPPAAGTPSPAVSLRTASQPGPTGPAARLRAAVDAYRGMWAAYETAGETANPDDPQLATYAADSALHNLADGLRSVRDRGLVIKGDIVLNPVVTALEPADKPTSIEITDCADDSRSLLYQRSGEPFNDNPGGRRLIVATVKDIGGGVWKVVSFGVHDIDTCYQGVRK
jgi:hypothetical protein